MLPAGLGNELGHWEPEEAVALHDRLLEAAGTSVNGLNGPTDAWFETPAAQTFLGPMRDLIEAEFAQAPLFVFKDPRTALIFPMWRRVLAELGVRCLPVVITRHPLEAAASLVARQAQAVPWQSWTLDRAGLLWLRYVLAAERHSRSDIRAFCTYERLLTDWRGVARRLAIDLDIEWPRSLAPSTHFALRPVLHRACALSDMHLPECSDHGVFSPPEPGARQMNSPAAAMHRRYQRFFAWTFALSTVMAAVLIWIELAFPPDPWVYPAPASAPTAAAAPASTFDLHDLQLLVTVAMLMTSAVSLVGLLVATPLAYFGARKARAQAAVEVALKRQDRINWLAAERAGGWPGSIVPMPRMRAHMRGRMPRRVHGGAHPG
ncbi:hypothetical protein [Variovorax defluvii]|uniref:sulfotransferase family protein n=1 Tax=Variovorax defluvii TaxID=913761 RepID=UPI0031ED48DA